MSDDIEENCRWYNDVECPFASGYEDCPNCEDYEEDTRKHPLDDGDRGDYLYEQWKDKMMEGEE